jgi:hypothetical protein
MPTVSTPNLTLSESDGRVTMEVRYEATFSKLDRELFALGQEWHSHVALCDFDGGDSAGATLVEFPRREFPNVDTATQPISVVERFTVDRDVLRGDTDGSDELKAKVKIHAVQSLADFTPEELSDTETLPSS